MSVERGSSSEIQKYKNKVEKLEILLKNFSMIGRRIFAKKMLKTFKLSQTQQEPQFLQFRQHKRRLKLIEPEELTVYKKLNQIIKNNGLSSKAS